MEQRKLNFTICECGREISIRALARHLRESKVNHSDKFKDECIKLIEWQKRDRWAWLVADGENAIGDFHWCAKVLNGQLKLEQLTFTSPRKLGQVTPKTAEKMSKDRSGKGNPALKDKPIYDVQEIKKFALDKFQELIEDCRKFKKLKKAINKKFPEYAWSFVGMFPKENEGERGYSWENHFLSFLLDKPIDWLLKEKAMDRGKFISIGQRKSPKFKNIQNAARETFKTKSRITIPHRTLFNMVLSLDPTAYKEKQIDYENTWKSYDICSPIKNILIEMHGRIWHDLDSCTDKIRELVTGNVKNDKIKEKLAIESGYELIVFWDDECDVWEDQLEEIYGKRPKSYKQALREELDKKRSEGGI